MKYIIYIRSAVIIIKKSAKEYFHSPRNMQVQVTQTNLPLVRTKNFSIELKPSYRVQPNKKKHKIKSKRHKKIIKTSSASSNSPTTVNIARYMVKHIMILIKTCLKSIIIHPSIQFVMIMIIFMIPMKTCLKSILQLSNNFLSWENIFLNH